MLLIKGFHAIYVLLVFVEKPRRSYAHKKQRNCKNGPFSDAISDKDIDDIEKLKVP